MRIPTQLELEDSKELNIRFGNHIRELRQAKNLSTIQMSRRCYMDSGNYVRIEQGLTNPTLKTLAKLCTALDITLQELFENFHFQTK